VLFRTWVLCFSLCFADLTVYCRWNLTIFLSPDFCFKHHVITITHSVLSSVLAGTELHLCFVSIAVSLCTASHWLISMEPADQILSLYFSCFSRGLCSQNCFTVLNFLFEGFFKGFFFSWYMWMMCNFCVDMNLHWFIVDRALSTPQRDDYPRNFNSGPLSPADRALSTPQRDDYPRYFNSGPQSPVDRAPYMPGKGEFFANFDRRP
jgi:hypothetical protein